MHEHTPGAAVPQGPRRNSRCKCLPLRKSAGYWGTRMAALNPVLLSQEVCAAWKMLATQTSGQWHLNTVTAMLARAGIALFV